MRKKANVFSELISLQNYVGFSLLSRKLREEIASLVAYSGGLYPIENLRPVLGVSLENYFSPVGHA